MSACNLCFTKINDMKQDNKIYIKGMVCQRCISYVKNQLESAGIPFDEISLGEVTLSPTAAVSDPLVIGNKLSPLGFTLIEDKRTKLVRDVKALIKELYSGDFDFPNRFRFSELLSQKLNKDYDTINMTFASLENSTLEKYIIDYRIEKVKEYLVYTNDTLADISFKLGFSSVAHLSRQFKQQTGINPSYFRQRRDVA